MCDIAVLNTETLRGFIRQTTNETVDIMLFGTASCKLFVMSLFFFLHLSTWTLTLVTVERVVSVVRPLKAHIICSKFRVVVAWIIMCGCLLAADSYLLVMTEMYNEDNKTKCWLQWEAERNTRYEELADLIIIVIVPCIILFTGNGIIIVNLVRAHRRHRHAHGTSNSHNTSSVTVMLCVVSVVFLLLTLPSSVFFIGRKRLFPNIENDELQKQQASLTFTVTTLLYHINSMINFLLYVLSGRKFRQAFVGLFCRCFEKEKQNRSHVIKPRANEAKSAVGKNSRLALSETKIEPTATKTETAM